MLAIRRCSSMAAVSRNRRTTPPRQLLLLLLLLLSCMDGAKAKTVLLFGTYPAQAADFGMEITSGQQINVMYPPENSTVRLIDSVSHARWVRALCEYTSDMQNIDNQNELPANNASIAFFVDIRGCSAQKQSSVAAKMRSVLSDKVRYIVLQGHDDGGHVLQTLQPDKDDDLESVNESIGILYVTYPTGIELRKRIKRRHTTTGGELSPFFMDPTGKNRQWTLLTTMTEQQDGGGGGRFSFYWFFFLPLLVELPCFYVLYRWWSGGGRIKFRRDARGRVRGFRYVPPRHWLLSRRLPGGAGGASSLQVENDDILSRRAATFKLSEEQFCKLPEIVYSMPHSSSIGDFEGDADIPEQHPQLEMTAVGKSDSSTPEQQDGDGNHPHHPAEETCSICIEDFVPGERLMLLPRCQHAFHRACIHPWLTERLRCCPKCKTNVIDEDDQVMADAAEVAVDEAITDDLEEAVGRDGEEEELEPDDVQESAVVP